MQLFSLPLEPPKNLRPVPMGVLVGNTLSEYLHIGNRLDSGRDQVCIRGL